MLWWIWLLVGFALLIGELLLPSGLFLLFLGIGAALVALLTLLAGLDLLWQLILLPALSLIPLGLFRRSLLARWQHGTRALAPPDIVGETAHAAEHIPCGRVGRAELRGTIWTARNVGDTHLRPAERCIVERVDGLTLLIRAEP